MITPGIVAGTLAPALEFGDDVLGTWTGTVYMGLKSTTQAFDSEDSTYPAESNARLTADASMALSITSSTVVTLWSRSGSTFSSLDTYTASNNIRITSIAPDGSWAGITLANGDVIIFDLTSNDLNTSSIISNRWGVGFSSDGTYFATMAYVSGTEWTMEIRQTSTPGVIHGSVSGLYGTSTTLTASFHLNWEVSDTRIIAVNLTDDVNIVVNSSTPSAPSALLNDSSQITSSVPVSAAFSPDNQYLVIPTVSHKPVVLNVSTWLPVSIGDPSLTFMFCKNGSFTPDGDYYVCVGSNGDASNRSNLVVYRVSNWSVWYESADTRYNNSLPDIQEVYDVVLI